MVEEVEDYAILMLRSDGTIANWNRGAAKIKGYSADEIIGRHFRVFYPPEDQQRELPESLLREAATRGKATHEGWRVRKDGTRFWGSVVITAIHNENNDIIGYTKVTRDLTERKLAEDQLRHYAELLEQKNHELQQFAYVAGHDLRAPLNRIIRFGDLLGQKQHQLDEQGRDYLQRMQRAATRMAGLLDGLQALTRLDARPLDATVVDLNHVVSEVLEDLDAAARNADVTVDPLPEVRANPTQMRQLFQNLLANSLKFNDKANPQIAVESAPVKNETGAPFWQIVVRDNGIGFAPSEAQHIFELFHRLHGDLEYNGTGLGLALCKKIVERHGGTITADAVPGAGASFTILLPEH
jgi:PAS domain S-box-containing protein